VGGGVWSFFRYFRYFCVVLVSFLVVWVRGLFWCIGLLVLVWASLWFCCVMDGSSLVTGWVWRIIVID